MSYESYGEEKIRRLKDRVDLMVVNVERAQANLALARAELAVAIAEARTTPEDEGY